jgi:hypothetical protein
MPLFFIFAFAAISLLPVTLFGWAILQVFRIRYLPVYLLIAVVLVSAWWGLTHRITKDVCKIVLESPQDWFTRYRSRLRYDHALSSYGRVQSSASERSLKSCDEIRSRCRLREARRFEALSMTNSVVPE